MQSEELNRKGQEEDCRRVESRREPGQSAENRREPRRAAQSWGKPRQGAQSRREPGQSAQSRREPEQGAEDQGTVGQQAGNQMTGWQDGGLTEEEKREQARKDAERRRRRQKRMAEMKREKHRRVMLFRYGVPGVAVLCLLLLAAGIRTAAHSGEDRADGRKPVTHEAGGADGNPAPRQPSNLPGTMEEIALRQLAGLGAYEENALLQVSGLPGTSGENTPQQLTGLQSAPEEDAPQPVLEAYTTENTNGFSDTIISEYGILIDAQSGEVLAQKGGWERINPASMTKILTVLVAAEHMTDFDGTFTMTIDITDYSFRNDCSNVGFGIGEVIPVKDLFYGTVLPSGADAALGLAYYVAGSQEAFVDMMNEKLEELGLSETSHFTNCVGLYDENHYSTPNDMAVILKAAADNEFCREVLSEHHYVTAPTAEHPEGIDISNWFLRRIEDRDTHGEVLCGKTGYVVQSKSCAASLAADHNGKEYICVTAGSDSSWTCIRDQVELYQRYLPE